MPDWSVIRVRPRTDADLDILFAIAADLETWEERTEGPSRGITRGQFGGRQREHAWVRGRYEDTVRMGILRSDGR